MLKSFIKYLCVLGAALALFLPQAKAVESVYQYTLVISAADVTDGKIAAGKTTTVTATLKDRTGQPVAADTGSFAITLSGAGTLGSVSVATDEKSASAQYTASGKAGEVGVINSQATKLGSPLYASLQLTVTDQAAVSPGVITSETPPLEKKPFYESILNFVKGIASWDSIANTDTLILLSGIVVLALLLLARRRRPKNKNYFV